MLKKKIVQYAQSRGIMNANELHEKTGLPRTTCYRLFNSRFYPSQKTLQILMDFWDCNREDLIEDIKLRDKAD